MPPSRSLDSARVLKFQRTLAAEAVDLGMFRSSELGFEVFIRSHVGVLFVLDQMS